jgi:membrane protease YdiL (CAAX protease family)
MTNPPAVAANSLPGTQESRKPIAGAIHTIVLLAMLGEWAYFSVEHANEMRTVAAPNHMLLYLRTMAFEWAMFAFIYYGIRRRGVTLRDLVGPRWSTARKVQIDIGIGLAFFGVSVVALALAGRLLHDTSSLEVVRFMSPSGPVEMAMWMVLSLTAGICEETIFRGYLQRQFISWTKVPAVGILVSGAFFGACHTYQGTKHAIAIAVQGVLFGILAAWRRSLKPGMISHAVQDSIGGIVLNRMVNH